MLPGLSNLLIVFVYSKDSFYHEPCHLNTKSAKQGRVRVGRFNSDVLPRYNSRPALDVSWSGSHGDVYFSPNHILYESPEWVRWGVVELC